MEPSQGHQLRRAQGFGTGVLRGGPSRAPAQEPRARAVSAGQAGGRGGRGSRAPGQLPPPSRRSRGPRSRGPRSASPARGRRCRARPWAPGWRVPAAGRVRGGRRCGPGRAGRARGPRAAADAVSRPAARRPSSSAPPQLGPWSWRGCRTVPLDALRTRCLCDRLSTFAILAQLSADAVRPGRWGARGAGGDVRAGGRAEGAGPGPLRGPSVRQPRWPVEVLERVSGSLVGGSVELETPRK